MSGIVSKNPIGKISGSGNDSIVEFEGSTELSTPASSVTVTIADATKKKYEIQMVGEYEGTTTRATNVRINGLSTAIYDYQHNRYFSGSSSSTAQAQNATEALIDNNGAVADGDVLAYTITLMRVVGGWLGTIHGARNITTLSNVTSISSFFVSDDNNLTSVTVLFSVGNLKTATIKAWGFGES